MLAQRKTVEISAPDPRQREEISDEKDESTTTGRIRKSPDRGTRPAAPSLTTPFIIPRPPGLVIPLATFRSSGATSPLADSAARTRLQTPGDT